MIDLLLKKLEGQLTDQEEVDFQSWLEESEENLDFYQKMEMLRKEGKGYELYQKMDIDAAWNQVLQKGKSTQSSHSPAAIRPIYKLFSKYRTPLAAAIALLIGTTALVYYLHFFVGEVRIQTAYGEKIAFLLPDQSEIILNANSELRYKKSQPRTVWLDGEAFFQVNKKTLTNEKFWVITRDLKVEVLGTAFNVNSHQEQTKVFLEEGRVKLALQNDSISEIFLVPGEMLTYSTKKGKTFEKTRPNTELESSWKAGIQFFDKAPLEEVLKKMEDIYGVSIALKDMDLEALEVTIGIPVEDLEIALSTIENITELNITRKNSTTFVLE